MATEKGESNPGCNGCKSENVATWCQTCVIKSCAREKGFSTCIECSDFPCKITDEFKFDKNYPYHLECYSSLELRNEKGKDVWLQSMDSRWRCTSCNTRFNWWMEKCSECGSHVKGYKNPN